VLSSVISFYNFQPILCVRLQAGSPPQLLLPLIQTRRLRFFGHVARMSDSQDTFRALHTSTRGLPKDWRCCPGRPRHTWLRTLNADLHPLNHGLNSCSMATCPGQRTMEVTRGNGYTLQSAWGSLVIDDGCADPWQDHHRALQACILGPPGDWRRRIGRPRQPGLEPLKTTCDH